MAAEIKQAPGLFTLVSRLARTSLGAIHNRFELLSLEWQEERARLSELLVWIIAFLFFGVMAAVLVTTTVILICPQDTRIYVAGGFCLFYLMGAVFAWVMLRALLRRESFSESIDQAKRDREWLKSFD